MRLVYKEKIEAIFTVPWDHFTVAAYFIHKITGRPLYMYIMDDPAGRRSFGGLQPMAYALLMPRIVRACKRVWGVREGMCEYFEKAYGVKCLPLLPLVDLESFLWWEAQTVPFGRTIRFTLSTRDQFMARNWTPCAAWCKWSTRNPSGVEMHRQESY